MKYLKRRKNCMKFLVHVDSNSYVTGLELTTQENGVIVPDEIYNSQNQNCYKYIGGEFIFDDSKKERLEAISKNQIDIEILKRNLTNTDYIWNVINEGDHNREYYKDIIEQRHNWRMQIRSLEEENKKLNN